MAEPPALVCSDTFGWQSFKNHFISKDGRVIDPATSNAYTTSEGQSYGLFFALLANDHKMFAKLLSWTQNNLAGGDLKARLPAWQWGKQKSGRWDVTDKNSASDSDLWIAYSLLEAGRLWKSEYYSEVGLSLSERILDQETAIMPGLGLSLLPAPHGFIKDKNTWRLNPSYVPLFLLRGMAHHNKDRRWDALINASNKLLLNSAPKGFAPDWIEYNSADGFEYYGEKSSYDAIRVYMWIGMMDDKDSYKKALLDHYAPMSAHMAQNPKPPEQVNVQTGQTKNHGPIGFSAALLPFLHASNNDKGLQMQLMRLVSEPLNLKAEVYYDQVLAIFAINWMNRMYKFDHNGLLVNGCTQKPT